MKIYTAGFLFDSNEEHVVLIRKNRPSFMVGKLNAVGGKVEEGESPHECQVREFEEETGVHIKKWDLFCVLSSDTFIVYFYKFHSDKLHYCKTVTDETIHIFEIDDPIIEEKSIIQLPWLLKMALTDSNIVYNVEENI